MKQRLLLITALSILTPLSLQAEASPETDELVPVEAEQAFYSEFSLTPNTLQLTENGHEIRLGLRYDFTLVGGMQFGIATSYSSLKVGATSVDTLIALVGPTFNFPFKANVSNAFFISLGVGITYVSAGTASATEFTFAAEIGKRVHLIGGVNYKPSVSVLKISGADAIIGINPIAFSIVF